MPAANLEQVTSSTMDPAATSSQQGFTPPPSVATAAHHQQQLQQQGFDISPEECNIGERGPPELAAEEDEGDIHAMAREIYLRVAQTKEVADKVRVKRIPRLRGRP